MTSKILCSIAAIFALVMSAGCGSCTPAPPPRGSVSLTWSLKDRHGAATTCEHVGASTISLALRNRATGEHVSATFACTATRATTSLLAPGAYDVALSLLALDGTVLATVPGQLAVTVVAGQVATLPPITFTADANASGQGKLVLSVTTPPNTSNCKTTGAGITAAFLTLNQVEGSCAAITFVRTRDGKQIGTYAVGCSVPINAGCIEADETFTAPIDAGSYAVHVRGKLGGLDCWTLDEVLDVTPGATLTRTLKLVHQSEASTALYGPSAPWRAVLFYGAR
jgi:hypothetical protein